MKVVHFFYNSWCLHAYLLNLTHNVLKDCNLFYHICQWYQECNILQSNKTVEMGTMI